MKKVCLLSLTLCAGAFAQTDTVVHWRGIEGVITAPGVDNPVGQIHSGAGPWTTRSGNARIDLASGTAPSGEEGLVLKGRTAGAPPGAVTNVGGTLECTGGSPKGTFEAVIN